jgi:hypothetical protein
MIWTTSGDHGPPEWAAPRLLGWALLLALGVAGCGDLRIEPPRGLLGDRECWTCDSEGGRYGP